MNWRDSPREMYRQRGTFIKPGKNILKSIVIAYAQTRDPSAITHAFVWVVDSECLTIPRLLIPIVTLTTTNNLLSTWLCESIDLFHSNPVRQVFWLKKSDGRD